MVDYISKKTQSIIKLTKLSKSQKIMIIGNEESCNIAKAMCDFLLSNITRKFLDLSSFNDIKSTYFSKIRSSISKIQEYAHLHMTDESSSQRHVKYRRYNDTRFRSIYLIGFHQNIEEAEKLIMKLPNEFISEIVPVVSTKNKNNNQNNPYWDLFFIKQIPIIQRKTSVLECNFSYNQFRLIGNKESLKKAKTYIKSITKHVHEIGNEHIQYQKICVNL